MTIYPDIRLRKRSDPKKAFLFEVVENCKVNTLVRDVIVPSGTVTDFASVPRWLWIIFPPHGKMANASVVHDFMYDNRIFEKELGKRTARWHADQVFLGNMINDGVSESQALVYYVAVRWFGRSWWDN
tara:strand:- start:808 stop:1191 length:384 start_codon:yes stop_codon:yes gene_type:complete